MLALLDTNLLVLLIVGSASRRYIGVHKRTRVYSPDDFDRLRRRLDQATGLLTTPNILSEASNLARQIREPARSVIGAVLQRFIASSAETYVESSKAASHPSYLRLGLTDAAILEAQTDDVVLLTDDLDLYLASARAGRAVINFSHDRDGPTR